MVWGRPLIVLPALLLFDLIEARRLRRLALLVVKFGLVGFFLSGRFHLLRRFLIMGDLRTYILAVRRFWLFAGRA